MHISVGNEVPGVARLDGTEPERRVCRLRRQHVGDIGPLNIFVVQRTRIEHRIFSRPLRAIDVQHKARSIAHHHGNVALLDHRFAFPAADNSKPTALSWKHWPFYFTSGKYNMSASLAQAAQALDAIGVFLAERL